MIPYYYLLSSFFLCLAMTPVVRYIAIKNRWMATPSAQRWHQKPTALMGGIAIYAGLSLPLLLAGNFKTLLPVLMRHSSTTTLPSLCATLWICITFLFILGLVDDFVAIKPQTKLVGQILVASFISFLGFRLHWFNSLTLDTMITMVWVVGVTNAFNLIDNMDGLCTGIGLIAAVCMALLFQGTPFAEGMLASLILAGALAAFLIFNFKPASIFMGDSGSLVIGFTLSLLTLQHSESVHVNSISFYAVPLLVMMVPIFDTILVSVIRILSGRKASVGGKDHTSHRLVLMGLNEKNAVLFLYGIGVLSGMSAVFVSRTDNLTSPIVIAPTVISLLLMGIYLAQLRVYPEKEFSVLRDKSYTPILVDITYKKQLLLVILDFGMISFAYYLSYRLRFESSVFLIYFKVFLNSLPAIIACKLLVFFVFGIYRSMWGYMSTSDVFLYVKASTVASLLSVAAVTFMYRFEDFSKGIVIIDWLLATGYLLASRGSFRIFIDTIKRKQLAGRKTLIYGAGRGGEILLREILNNTDLHVHPIGFIDDDIRKTGKKIQGYPVLGKLADVEQLCQKYQVEEIIVSFTDSQNDTVVHLAKICRQQELSLKGFKITLADISHER
jgi:UDP-GlcNAc:undecaprenyl-phosphate/decaprenyl-phosphate GlcNAc-1-phosphate transferase